MKKLRQSFVFLSLIFVLILGCMAVNAFAEDTTDVTVLTSGDCGYNGAAVTYTLTSDGVFTVDGNGLMDSYPFNFNEATGMMESTMPWKDYLDDITKVVINDGVLNVSQGSFNLCTNLETVELADSVTRIDGYAFGECSKLTDINTANITYFGETCFAYCTGLTKLDLTAAEDIMAGAFMRCQSINTITFGNNLKTIGEQSFSGLTSLEAITIPSSVTSIGESAFYSCSNLKSVVVPEGITSIPQRCFEGCYALEGVSLPSTLKVLGNRSFIYCGTLKSIDLPPNLTTIGKEAFYNCESMENITIPDSVTSIGPSAFYGCKKLDNVVIPKNVTTISEGTFAGCMGLKNINIPEGVTTIENFAFNVCDSLSEIDIPDSVTLIENDAFCNCASLERVIIPQNVSVISDGMFYNCTALKSVELPKGVKSIGADVFTGCTALNTIYCYEDNACVNTYVDENLSNVEKKYIVEDNSIALTDLNTAGNSLNVQVDTTQLGGEVGTTPYLEAVNIIVDDTAKALTNHTYDSTEQFANFNVTYGNTSGAESVDVRGEAVTKASKDDSVLKKYVTKVVEIVLGGN